MPSVPINIDFRVDGEEYPVTEFEFIRDRYSTTGELRVWVVTDETSTSFINNVHTMTLEVMGHLVFTGEIVDAKKNDMMTVELIGHDAIRKLLNSTLTEEYNALPLEDVARDAFDEAGVQNYEIDLPDNLGFWGGFTETPCIQVIDFLARMGEALWYCEPDNTISLTIDPEIRAWKLGDQGNSAKSVLSASAGKTTRSYDKVVVYANVSGESEQNRESAKMVASNPIIATAGEGDSVYEVTQVQVETAEQAHAMARSILSELRRQEAGGTVTISGDPGIRVLDLIEMPDHMGSEFYLVSGIEHTVNNDDGLETMIQCGGLVTDPSDISGFNYSTETGAITDVGGHDRTDLIRLNEAGDPVGSVGGTEPQS